MLHMGAQVLSEREARVSARLKTGMGGRRLSAIHLISTQCSVPHLHDFYINETFST